MAKLSGEELKQRLDDARAKVEIGSNWVHYKSPDMKYKITDVVINEADNDVLVIYEALYEGLEDVRFARKIDIFLEEVELESGEHVARFKKV